ncbi:sigma-70 family RNA polymerase sigma factor [Occultella glacieicola]|uniref:Sigma-70 family RNA polymerase sigma factor n=1 Tax=Occultella glacieicola TaxID=2518684 RepID=A0ABY2EBH9_9MICO|nr:sigma-70 family RNA polymerase sigma factor [Occultella glacieicola]TDE99133.1 sigma-70 family RNA polymerase sigma factor [Occultella glacieicola]
MVGPDLTFADEDPDAAFESFVRERGGALYRAAWALALDPADAEDLTQEVLARTYRHWRRIRRSGADPFAYARRALVNLRVDRWRRRSRESATLQEYLSGTRPAEAPSAVEDRAELAGLLDRLSLQQRRVVVLRYVLDLPVAVVARELRISESNVKTTSSRALALMRAGRQNSLEES